jgi:hypothetical protein
MLGTKSFSVALECSRLGRNVELTGEALKITVERTYARTQILGELKCRITKQKRSKISSKMIR